MGLVGDNAANALTSHDNLTREQLDSLVLDTDDTVISPTELGNANTAGWNAATRVTDTITVTAAEEAVPMAHIDSDSSAMLAGQYAVGGMTFHLGYGERKWDTDSMAATWDAKLNEGDGGYGAGLKGDDLLGKKKKTTFFGVSSDLGDTGVWFHLQVRSNKTNMSKVTSSYADGYDAAKAVYDALPATGTPGENNDKDEVIRPRAIGETDAAYNALEKSAGDFSGEEDPATATADRARGMATSSTSNTPWTLAMSRSLGGGASVHFEHTNLDNKDEKNTSSIFLLVNF